MRRILRVLRQAIVILFWGAVVAAPFVSHAAISTGRFSRIAIGFAAIQAAAVALMSWRARGLVRMAGLAVASLLASVAGARLLQPEGAAAALLTTSGLSHAALYASLLLLFGLTLQPGQTPLVTTMATRMQGPLTPAMTAYTRRVTLAWCGFFAGQLVISALLLASAPHRVWSLYVNVLDGPLVALMFAAEYGVRRLRFRGVAHVSPIAIMRRFGRDKAALGNG